MSLTPYNSTLPSDAAAFQAYGNAVAWAMIMSYFIGLTWVAANWGNHPGARAWTTIGQITDPRSGVSYQAIRDAIGEITEIVAPLPRPIATGWRHIGEITFSPGDVKPQIMQNSPLYERTYASGKKSWRFWDDATEEWVYHTALPANVLYN